jgi:hypothetical protein
MGTKTAIVTYSAEFSDDIEVPADWEWDGTLDSLLEFTDLSFANGGILMDWEVR